MSLPIASIRLFGEFAFATGGRELLLSRRAQALLALLALAEGGTARRETVANMLWGERGAQQERQSLRQCLWTIRRDLDCNVVEAGREVLRIATDSVTIDVSTFRDVGRLTYSRTTCFSRCAALYRGELLTGFSSISPQFDEWLITERRRLAGVAAGATLRRLAEAHLAAGASDAAVTAAQRLVALDDLNEDSHRRLMHVLVQAGRRAEALRHYEVCVSTLRRDLQVAPEPETAALSELIKRGGYASSKRAGDAGTPLSAVDAAAEQDLNRALRPAPSIVMANLAARRNPLRHPYLVSLFAAICFVVVILGVETWKRPNPLLPRVAVLPFVNVSSIPDQASPIAGLTDLIAEQLQEKQSLRVVQYRDEASSPTPLSAADPSVRYFVEGSAAFSATLKISARVLDRTGAELWSGHYDDARSNIFEMVTDIAMHTARGVAQDRDVHQSAEAPLVPTFQSPQNLLALATYVRFRVDGASNAAFRQIAQDVVDHEPNNATALALVANSYLTEFAVTGAPHDLSEAETRLDRVLQQDPINFNALWDKCSLLRLQGNPADALEVCRRALDINPHHPGTLREIAYDLLDLDDAPEAIAWFNAAIAADPGQPFVGAAYKGIALGDLSLGDTDAALAAFHKSVEHDYRGNVAGLFLAGILESSGRDSEAKATLAEFFRHHPEIQPAGKAGASMIPALDTQPPIVAEGLRQLGLGAFTKGASFLTAQ